MKSVYRFLITLLLASVCLNSAASMGSLGLKKNKSKLLHTTSFEETQNRYLAPLDMIDLFMDRFPFWTTTSSCDPTSSSESTDAKSLRILLGENKPATGEPDTVAPGAGLINQLKACADLAIGQELQQQGVQTGSYLYYTEDLKVRFTEILSYQLKKFIPCRPEFCSQDPNEWSKLKVKDLSSKDQRLYIRALLLRVWGTLKVYEEMNNTSSEDLISALQKQTENLTMVETYKKVQIWAAFRDEFLMF